jgi:hypothetical protein
MVVTSIDGNTGGPLTFVSLVLSSDTTLDAEV